MTARNIQPDIKTNIDPLVELLAAAIDDAVLVYDADGTIIYANGPAVTLFAAPGEGLIGKQPEEVAGRFELLDESGSLLAQQMLPGRRVLNGEPNVEGVLGYRRPGEGDRWIRVKSQSLPAAGGKPAMVVTILHDLGPQRIAQNADFMTRAGGILYASLDYGSTLQNLARLTVPAMADWCAIDLIEDGVLKPVTILHRDEGKTEIAQRVHPALRAAFQMHAEQQTGTSAGVLIEEISPDLIDAAIGDSGLAEAVKSLSLRSAVIVPLTATGPALGQMYVCYGESNRRYSQRDLQLLVGLGRRAGLALDNARLYRESELAREDLERAIKAKDEFVGFVAHELRTPITTIFGSARLLNRPNSRFSDEERGELVQSIADESTRMAALIENLLVLSRMELGAQVQRESVAIGPVVERAVSSLRAATPRRRLEVQVQDGASAVLAQDTYLEQILQNLLSNANKFSPIDEPIELVIEPAGGEVSFRVLDKGPGVQPDEIERLFDNFFRARTSAGLPGKGLGLSVCKRLTEALGGRIWAVARDGGGFEVGFTLPAA